jgi:hypothetical protein
MNFLERRGEEGPYGIEVNIIFRQALQTSVSQSAARNANEFLAFRVWGRG